jgi:hypothetical protein
LLTIARITIRKLFVYYFTLLLDLVYTTEQGQVKILQQARVFYIKAYIQELGITIPTSVVCKVTGIVQYIQSQIFAFKQVRIYYNQPDLGPDLQSRKRALIQTDTTVIADYFLYNYIL